MEFFLQKHNKTIEDLNCFIAHLGGKKVLDAYCEALQLNQNDIKISLEILMNYGNMSSATIFYVLKKLMENNNKKMTLAY
ncbi:3-oxoacyl-[acyl-carrier-protein] synthase III C-terminal domain-containing protein [Calidifontibacillus oryziterrae]|uniref:3-oxoacyl-[acyl-carrier-protein] synthase III C-terminal domain-containing protein n=1 Tax=Calidifontibacillus oryziterrae TaxID=1191699 RepID=UPI0008FC14A8|nr:3-oxoacyl-[acyl-carrier-protein] synthase III C-terminal domain-containing protein [Calidifontibacillus oryziterrae]